MTAEDLEKYDEVKMFLLAEYKLTPREYKDRFDSAVKGNDETYVLFAVRLRNLLLYYLRSRNVDDFEGVCDLLVSDKLKTCLTGGQLNYVLSLEGEHWFRPDKVATLADIHLNNRPSLGSSKPVDNRYAKANTTMVNVDSHMSGVTGGRVPSRDLHGRGKGSLRCYVCNAVGHIAIVFVDAEVVVVTGGSNRGNPGKVQVNLCTTMDVPPKNDVGTQCEAPHNEPKVDEVEDKWAFAAPTSPVN